MKQKSHHVFDQQIIIPSHLKKNRNKNNIETCSKMKEDVGIVITNNCSKC